MQEAALGDLGFGGDGVEVSAPMPPRRMTASAASRRASREKGAPMGGMSDFTVRTVGRQTVQPVGFAGLATGERGFVGGTGVLGVDSWKFTNGEEAVIVKLNGTATGGVSALDDGQRVNVAGD